MGASRGIARIRATFTTRWLKMPDMPSTEQDGRGDSTVDASGEPDVASLPSSPMDSSSNELTPTEEQDDAVSSGSNETEITSTSSTSTNDRPSPLPVPTSRNNASRPSQGVAASDQASPAKAPHRDSISSPPIPHESGPTTPEPSSPVSQHSQVSGADLLEPQVSEPEVSEPEVNRVSKIPRRILDSTPPADTHISTADPDVFADFRSAAVHRKRALKQREKYYNFRGINLGHLNVPHHVAPRDYSDRRLPADWDVALMTKKLLYEEAQRYPKPPRRHRADKEKVRWPLGVAKKRLEEKKWGKHIWGEELVQAQQVIDLWEQDEETSMGNGNKFLKPGEAQTWKESRERTCSDGLAERVMRGERGGHRIRWK